MSIPLPLLGNVLPPFAPPRLETAIAQCSLKQFEEAVFFVFS
jgi:hypothetical protein